MDVKLWVATKAFLDYQGKILILRESGGYGDGTNASRYDVPGGRVQPGQRFDESLLREIKEETGLEAVLGRPFFAGEWRPVVRSEQWQIVGTYFEATANSQKVVLGTDHDDFKWIDPDEYERYPVTENVAEAFEAYLELKR